MVVTDIFNPVLSEVSVALNGTAWTEGADYTYNETTGEFITTAGRITVPAAAFTQESATGAWVSNPGVSVLTVTGRV